MLLVKLSKVLICKTEVSPSLSKKEKFPRRKILLIFGYVYKLIVHEGHIEDFSISYDFSIGVVNRQVRNLYKAVLLCRTKYLCLVPENMFIEYSEDP